MALYGFMWPCMVSYGLFYLIWRPMVLYGLLWSFMVKYWFFWTCIVFSRGHRSKFIWSCSYWRGIMSKNVPNGTINVWNDHCFKLNRKFYVITAICCLVCPWATYCGLVWPFTILYGLALSMWPFIVLLAFLRSLWQNIYIIVVFVSSFIDKKIIWYCWI